MKLTAAHVQAARQELARRHLLDFTSYTLPGYQSAPHHRLIASALEDVERGECDRLMIFMPPRHGKSELASRRWPAWCLGRNRDRLIVGASYNSDLANDFGREVKNIVNSEEFEAVFPGVELSPDSRANNRMNTNGRGAYVAAGVGTALTGRGFHIGLIDDPLKDRAEADSERQRDAVWAWYRSTFYTRQMPGGAIVLIQTRWHEDDLAGRLLNSGGDQWRILDLPAISDAGEALWPEWYSVEALQRIKDTIGPREWSALYQQKPQPDEGTFFQRDWFPEWKQRPAHMNVYGTSDYAVTEGGGDWTVHRMWGVDHNGNLYRLAGWRGQTTPDEWIAAKIELIKRWKPLAWFGEAGVIQKAVEPSLRRRMRETGAHCRLEWLPSIADKPARARGFQARAAMGGVWVEPGADISEYLAFPAGKHDDEVDCASLIGRALDDVHAAIVPTKPPPTNRPNDRYARMPSGSSEGGFFG